MLFLMYKYYTYLRVRIRVTVFNVTFNNISVISWQSCSFIGGGNRSTRRKPMTYHKSLKNFHIVLYWVRLAMSRIQNKKISGESHCKSNYCTITTTMALIILLMQYDVKNIMIKTIASVLKVLTYIITSNVSQLIVILAVMSMSPFIASLNLYIISKCIPVDHLN